MLDALSNSDNKLPMTTHDHLNSYVDLLRRYVAEDFDNGWLIFRSGPSEMGVHPTHSKSARLGFGMIDRFAI